MAAERLHAAIVNLVRDRAGPDTLDVVVIAPEQDTVVVRDNLQDRAYASTVEVVNAITLNPTLHKLSARPDRRLSVIVGDQSGDLELHVPGVYREVELVSADRQNQLHIKAGSKYGTVLLSQWPSRQEMLDNEFNPKANVLIDIDDSCEQDSGSEIPLKELLGASGETPEEMALLIQKRIQESQNDSDTTTSESKSANRNPLPWLREGAKMAAKVLSVKVSEAGLLVTVGPLGSTSGSVQGSPLVYFIPWKLVALWSQTAAQMFLDLVKSLWPAFGKSFETLVELVQRAFHVVASRVRLGVGGKIASVGGLKRSASLKM